LCPHRIITEALFIFQFAARVPEKKRTERARIKKRKKKKVTQKRFRSRAAREWEKVFSSPFESRPASRETSGAERYNYSSAKFESTFVRK